MLQDVLGYPTNPDIHFIASLLHQITSAGSSVSEERAILLLEYVREFGADAAARAPSQFADGSRGGGGAQTPLSPPDARQRGVGEPTPPKLGRSDASRADGDSNVAEQQRLVVAVVGVYHSSPWCAVKASALSVATSLAIEIFLTYTDAVIVNTPIGMNSSVLSRQETSGDFSGASQQSITADGASAVATSFLHAPWLVELLGVLVAHADLEVQMTSRASLAPHLALNETAMLCLRELVLVAPTVAGSFVEELRSLRGQWSAMSSKVSATRTESLRGVAALLDLTCSAQLIVRECYHGARKTAPPTGGAGARGTPTNSGHNSAASSLRNSQFIQQQAPQSSTRAPAGHAPIGAHCGVFSDGLGRHRKVKRAVLSLAAGSGRAVIPGPSESDTNYQALTAAYLETSRNGGGAAAADDALSNNLGVSGAASGVASGATEERRLRQVFDECGDALQSAVFCLRLMPPILMCDATLWLLSLWGCEGLKLRSADDVVSRALAADLVRDGESIITTIDHLARTHLLVLLRATCDALAAAPVFVASQAPQKMRGYQFGHGPDGLGMYRTDAHLLHAQAAAHACLRPLLTFADSVLLSASWRAALLSFLAVGSELMVTATARLESAARMWESEETLRIRLVTCALASRAGSSKAVGILRQLRDSSQWNVPAIRAAVVMVCAALIAEVPACRAACSTLLSTCAPCAISAVVGGLHRWECRQEERAQLLQSYTSISSRTRRRHGRRERTLNAGPARGAEGFRVNKASRETQSHRSSNHSFLPHDQQHDTRRGNGSIATARNPHGSTSIAAELLRQICATVTLNQSASQIVRSFPTLLHAFESPNVEDKNALLAHLTARISELDNTWYVGNALLMILRAFVVSEAAAITAAAAQATASSRGGSSSAAQLFTATRAFIDAMLKHFSDIAIAQHLRLLESTLTHLPLEELAFLLDVSATDADDVMRFCDRKGGSSIPIAPQVPIDIALMPLPEPFYLAAPPPNIGSLRERLTLEFAVRVVDSEDGAEDGSAGDGASAFGKRNLVGAMLRLYTSDSNRCDETLVLAQPLPILTESLDALRISVSLRTLTFEPPLIFVSLFAPQHPPVHFPEPIVVGFERFIRIIEPAVPSLDAMMEFVGSKCPMASQRPLTVAQETRIKQLVGFTVADRADEGVLHFAAFNVVPNAHAALLIVEDDVDAGKHQRLLVARASDWKCLSLVDHLLSDLLRETAA